MATQNSTDNLVSVVSLFPVSITTADNISLASSNEISIAGTNGTTLQDDTSIELDSSGLINITATGSLTLISNDGVTASVAIAANGANPAATMQIGCALGTSDESVLVYSEFGGITLDGQNVINLRTDVGDITLNASDQVLSTSTGSTVIISNAGVVGAVQIAANNADTDTTLQIGVPFGTDDEAVLVYAEAGGITLDANTGVHLNYGTDSVQVSNGAQTFEVLAGDTNPDGSVTALQGSLFVDTTGTGSDTLYVNTDGSTAWTALGGGGGGGGMTWNIVSSAGPITLAPNNGYFCAFAGLITFVLPTTAAVGDTYAIYNVQASSNWELTQNALQYVRFVGTATTIGTGGSLTGNTTGDGIQLTCFGANFFFIVTQAAGNPTIV